MNDSTTPLVPAPTKTRHVLVILVALVSAGCSEFAGPPSPNQLTVVYENNLPGTRDWYPARSSWAPTGELSLWASPYSAGPGDTLDVFVHATRGPVRLELFRLGWYRGLGGRRVWQKTNVTAGVQPPCSAPFPGPVECPWRRTLRVRVATSWVSGLYLFKATDNGLRTSFYPFVLRSARRADFTAIVPQFTWQAYNGYGGSSLYVRGPDGDLGNFVSFERPYLRLGGATYMFDARVSHDLRVVRWLERAGYDVVYQSDLELTGLIGQPPAPHAGLIFLGHDEYWTWSQFDRVEALRDAGVHLAFLSANNAYWNVRLKPGRVTGRPGHVIVCYKSSIDPEAAVASETTTRFRDAPLDRPENGLYGVMYRQGTAGVLPLVVADSGSGLETRAFLQASGLQPGDTLHGVVADEGDQLADNGRTPANLQVLFRSPINPNAPSPAPPFYYTTFFVAPSGAGIFAAGSTQFGAGLDSFVGTPVNPALQELMTGVLDWMRARPARQ